MHYYQILMCTVFYHAFEIFCLKKWKEMRPILAFDLTNFTDSCINVYKSELAGFSGATNHLTYIFVWHLTLTIILITTTFDLKHFKYILMKCALNWIISKKFKCNKCLNMEYLYASNTLIKTRYIVSIIIFVISSYRVPNLTFIWNRFLSAYNTF